MRGIDAGPGVRVRYVGQVWTVWSAGPEVGTRWLVRIADGWTVTELVRLRQLRLVVA